jgi:hypothetical protein
MKLSTNAETTRSNSPVRAGIAVALPITASIGRSPAPCLAAARYASEGSTPRTRAGCSLSGSSAPAPRFHIRRRTTLQGVTPAAATAGTAAQPVGSSARRTARMPDHWSTRQNGYSSPRSPIGHPPGRDARMPHPARVDEARPAVYGRWPRRGPMPSRLSSVSESSGRLKISSCSDTV